MSVRTLGGRRRTRILVVRLRETAWRDLRLRKLWTTRLQHPLHHHLLRIQERWISTTRLSNRPPHQHIHLRSLLQARSHHQHRNPRTRPTPLRTKNAPPPGSPPSRRRRGRCTLRTSARLPLLRRVRSSSRPPAVAVMPPPPPASTSTSIPTRWTSIPPRMEELRSSTNPYRPPRPSRWTHPSPSSPPYPHPRR